MPIDEIWSESRGIVRLTGPLDTATAFALVDAIQDSRNYYHYETLELHVADCPGGTHEALQYVLDHRGLWMDGTFTLRTIALTQVASAGALLVSMGTRGQRLAMPGARLLWHGVRFIATSSLPITVPMLHDLGSSLRLSEQSVLDLLVTNGSPEPATQAELRDRYLSLFLEERWITATEALEYALLDGIHTISAPMAHTCSTTLRR